MTFDLLFMLELTAAQDEDEEEREQKGERIKKIKLNFNKSRAGLAPLIRPKETSIVCYFCLHEIWFLNFFLLLSDLEELKAQNIWIIE